MAHYNFQQQATHRIYVSLEHSVMITRQCARCLYAKVVDVDAIYRAFS